MAIDLIYHSIQAQVESRMSAVDGFNATANAYYGSTFFCIDFFGGNFNYFRGQFDPTQLEQAAAIKYPLVTLFPMKAEDIHKQKFQTLDGMVFVGMDVHLAFPSSKAQFDFNLLPDSVATAVVDVLNRPDNQDWEPGTLYNGGVAVTYYPLRLAGTNWRQSLRFIMPFELVET